MADVELWPSLTFLFCAFNLAAWYFKGQTLFSWWWIVAVVAVQIVLVGLTLALAKAVVNR